MNPFDFLNKELAELAYEVRSRGYPIPSIIPDGRAHRFKMDSNDSKNSGSYRAHQLSNGSVMIEVSTFKRDLNPICLTHSERSLSDEEIKEQEKILEEVSKREDQKTTLLQETKKIESQQRWERAKENPHPEILLRRRILSNYGAREDWNSGLLVPMRDFQGELWNLEVLRPEQKGMVSKNSRKKGLFHLIGEIKEGEPLYIVESFTTGASLHQLSRGSAVACSFSASNMVEIAVGFRKKFPELEIIVSGDRDQTGERFSKQAAKKVGGRVLIPDFGFDHPEYTDWNDFYKIDVGEGPQMAVTEIENFKKNKNKKLGGVVGPAAEFEVWFNSWVKEIDLDMNYRGEFKLSGISVSPDFVDSRLYLDANSISKTFGKLHCQSALKIWVENKRNELKEAIISPLFEVPKENSRELEKFVGAVTSNEKTELTLAILKHFIWQVKRKMKGLRVQDEMMPVLSGPQRSGKTQAIAKLMAPLKELVGLKSVSSLTQDNQFPMFESFYVIICDEMARSAQADIDTLKGIITSTHLQTKRYYAQTQLHIKNNCTLIGSSNYTLDALLKDPTGMRRFFEVQSLEVCDWNAINSVDYLELWRSVDHTAENFIAPYLTEIQAIQEDLREPSDVEEFAEDCGILADEAGRMLTKELWTKYYIPWAEKNGVKYPKRPIPFGIEMKRLGFKNLKSHGKRYLKILLMPS